MGTLANWNRRTQLIEYCVGVVDQSLEEKRQSIQGQDVDPVLKRKTQAAMYSDEVKV